MNPNEPSNLPAFGGGYVPYFYQRGLHELYRLSGRQVPSRDGERSDSGRESFSLEARLPGFDRPETVEQIIAHGYFAMSHEDPVTAILSDKQHTTRLALDDAIAQIRQRYEIYEQNLYQIELGKCAAMNAVYAHIAYQGPPTSKQMYARHKAFQGLYEQERLERTELWKDVSRLRGLIPESAQLYLAASRKRSILGEAGEDE
jgi:hypothetical protein